MTHHIFHSGFLIYHGNAAVIIDFWADPTSILSLYLPAALHSAKKLYILVSHHHKDHFNPRIFEWRKSIGIPTDYIISNDTARLARPYFRTGTTYCGPKKIPEECVHIISPGKTFADKNITVTAFGSTDTGNSYLIEIADKIYYHAGDNNAWTFGEDACADASMTNHYTSILNTLKKHLATRTIDEAMLPCDSRLGSLKNNGIEIFKTIVGARTIHPMHDDNPPI